jgi:hypothetical protein
MVSQALCLTHFGGKWRITANDDIPGDFPIKLVRNSLP